MKTIKVRTVLVWLTLLMLTAGSSKSMIIGVHKKGIITGLVSNFETNQPFAFVSVEVYSATDSALVIGTLTDQEGQFTISMLDSGKYYVEINERNFKKRNIQPVVISESTAKVNLGEISLVSVPRKHSKQFSGKILPADSGEPQLIYAKNKVKR
ncbi:MAG: carboxypeptidase-like regulatory domain-containing protein [Bacteroidota bacterium]|nr:carboxypeptidase-like regulatory domain-containing protein [Bacteroidota bacterium]